jgi:hypothetical protein
MTTTIKRTKKAQTLDADIVLLDTLKAEAKEIDAQIKETQSRVLAALIKAGEKTHKAENEDGRIITATMVQQTATSIDAEALEAAVGEKKWLLISTRSLDMKKLEARIATEDIDAAIVAEVTTERPKSPYVLVK